MRKQFIGRGSERSSLTNEYLRERASFAVIYGRRRVGKTELALQFLREHGGIYFLADRRGYANNIRSFQKVVAREENMSLFAKARFGSWYDMFEEYISSGKSRVIVIDEYPYLVEEGVNEEFQKIWDLLLSKTNKMLILIGSSISMMEKAVLEYGAPLYGRRTMQIRVEKLSFRDARKFFPGYSLEQFIEAYSFLDGIPLYLEQFDDSLSLAENLITYYLRKDAFLYEEAAFLLAEEFRRPAKYFSILEAVSRGKRSFGEISDSTGEEKPTLSRYLSHLQEIGLLRDDMPVLSTKQRLRRYRFSDHYLSGWFRYVYPNRDLIESTRADEVIDLILSGLSTYVGRAFEDIINGIVWEKGYRISGQWWNRKGDEIDIVALNKKDNEVLFGEVKWTSKPVSFAVANELMEKAKLVTWNVEQRKEKFLVVSKAGFTPECLRKMDDAGVMHWDMADVERMIEQVH